MYERHEKEQYFFDGPTLDRLADFVSDYVSPCCVCAPMLGKTLVERDSKVAILDVDERFSSLSGFQRFDLYRPHFIEQRFDLIVCDPPFFNVSLSQLFHALRLLSQHDFHQPMLVSYLKRRSGAVLGTFARFGLEPTGYFPGYQTVQKSEKNEIEFFGNLGTDAHSRLSQP